MPKRSFDTMSLVSDVGWKVTQDGEGKKAVWVLEFLVRYPSPTSPRFIDICPVDRTPWELAVDAGLEFIDRLREGRIPATVEDPKTLMGICVSAARRQR